LIAPTAVASVRITTIQQYDDAAGGGVVVVGIVAVVDRAFYLFVVVATVPNRALSTREERAHHWSYFASIYLTFAPLSLDEFVG